MKLKIDKDNINEFNDKLTEISKNINLVMISSKLIVSRNKSGDNRFYQELLRLNKYTKDLMMEGKPDNADEVVKWSINVLIKYIYLMDKYSNLDKSEVDIIPESVFNFFRPLILDIE